VLRALRDPARPHRAFRGCKCRCRRRRRMRREGKANSSTARNCGRGRLSQYYDGAAARRPPTNVHCGQRGLDSAANKTTAGSRRVPRNFRYFIMKMETPRWSAHARDRDRAAMCYCCLSLAFSAGLRKFKERRCVRLRPKGIPRLLDCA